MQQSIKFWDGIAPGYARKPIQDMDAYTYTLERTQSYLSPKDRVLELGCGTGGTALRLAGSVGHIHATDVSPGMIRQAKQRLEKDPKDNVDFLAAGVFDQQLEGKQYDAVLAFNLIHLLPDTPAVMRRIGTLLKPGGLFISKTHCQPIAGAPFKYQLMRLILPVMQIAGRAPYVNFMSIQDLETAVTSAGFKILETGNYPANPPNRFIVAQMPKENENEN